MFSSWFRSAFTLVRTFGVFFLASQINVESRKTIKILHRVPSNLWNMEVKRFSSEVSCNMVALSGMKFFYLTPELILRVAGAITAYELFLMEI